VKGCRVQPAQVNGALLVRFDDDYSVPREND